MKTSHRWTWGTTAVCVTALWVALRQQLDGNYRGAPDPDERFVLTILPFVVLAFAVERWSRTTAYAVTFFVTSLVLLGWSGMITNDELGLTYWFVPAFQLLTVALVVLGVRLHRWWAARRQAPRA